MAKLIKEHNCDNCEDKTYFVRLAQPQAVRVAQEGGRGKPYMAYADYAEIRMHKGTYGKDENQKTFSEVSVWAADETEKSFTACIYHINQARTLDEVLWALGGEYDENRTEGKLNGTA